MKNKNLKSDSLVKNLAVSLSVTVAAVSVLVIMIIALAALINADNEINHDAEDAAKHLSAILENPVWNLDTETIMVIGEAFFQDKSVASLEIHGANGEKFFSESREEKKDNTSKVGEIFHEGEKIGFVRVVYSKEFYIKKILFLIENIMVINFFIILAVFFALKILISAFVKNPMDSFSQTVRSYSEGNYTGAFVEPKYDEFKPLAGVLAGMAAKIKNQFNDLERINSDLETKFKEQEALVEKLNASENKFRLAFDTSPDSINLNRLSDGLFVEINQGFTRIMGYEKQEVEGKNSLEIKIWENPQDRARLVEGLKEKGYIDNLEAVFRRKDGKLVTGLMSARLMKINNEPHIISITRDISERKLVENTLKENEEKFRMLFMESPDALAISSSETGEYLETNEGMSALCGYSREELAGKTAKSLNMWVDASAREEMLQTMKSTGVLKNMPVSIRDKKGEIHYVLMSAMTVEINKKKKLLTMARDITQRRKLEQAIAESEEKFRTLSEESMVAVMILQDDIVKYVNKGHEMLTGYTAEEVLSWKPWEFMKIVSQEYVEIVKEQVRKKQAGDKNVMNNYQVQFTIKNGSRKWVNVFSKSIMFGGRVADMATFVDITGIKLAQTELMNTVEQLERSNNELERFAYATSHDLQEPLNTVSNYVQLLRFKYKDKIDEDADYYIDTVVKSASHMSALIKGLLDLSKMGKVEKVCENVDMNQIAGEVKVLLDAKITETGAQISIGELPVIKAERIQMSQLIQNLMSNALKFSIKENNPKVEISCLKHLDNWVFCVKDNGIGISPKYFDKIFVVFQRLNSKADYEGSGIGLAICEKIVEHHKGKIWVESEEGKGAAFYFTIPV